MIRTSNLSRVLGLTLPVLGLQLALPGEAFAAGTDACASTPLVTALPYTDTAGTTVGETNDIASIPLACNGHFTDVAGPDVFYAIAVGTGASFTITVTPTPTYDPSIYFLSACDANTCTSGRGADEALAGGAETLTIAGTSPGIYFLVVDSFYATTDPRSSGAFTLSITGTLGTAVATQTLVASSKNPSNAGEAVTFTATVTSSAAAASGNVAFTIDNAAAGSAPLGGAGTASITTSTLTVGTHTVVATYGGDSTHGSSVSAPLSQGVDDVAPPGDGGLDDGGPDGGAVSDGGETDGGSLDGSFVADGSSADGGATADGGSDADGGATADGGSDADGGANADGSASGDGGANADGSTNADGGASADGSRENDAGPGLTTENGGCGCRTAGGSGDAGGAYALVWVPLAAWTARRLAWRKRSTPNARG
jgi:hypothetical protein